jgi:hypothetical protein
MRWAPRSAIDKLEREWSFDASSLRDKIQAGPRAAWLFLRVTGLLAAAALVAGFGLAAPAAAQVSDQPATATVYSMTPARIEASVAVVVGLIGAVIGGLALARSARRIGNGGRRGAIAALVLGTIGLVIGGLIVATAGGGVGTGNGLAGGVVAIMLGLIGMALGGLALARLQAPSPRGEPATSSIEGDTMAKQASLTRALLACGVVAGPMYVLVTMAQALTRDGFDLRQHRFSWLTAGDLGWIHQSNMVLVGVLTVLFVVGVRQVLRTGRGAVWGPRLLALFGGAYIVGGLLTADPVAGFPPGTTPEMVHTTWHGVVQNASRGASTLFLIAANLVIAMRFAAKGHRGWAWFYGAGFPVVLAALTAVGFTAIGDSSAFALAILATPWILVTVLAVHLYHRAAQRRHDMPAGLGTRTRPVAGHVPLS